MAWYQVNPLEILDTTNSTGIGTGGSLTVGGGVAVGGDAYFGGNINISGTSASFSDNIIILNAGTTTSQDTGFLLERVSTDVSNGNNYSALVYSESTDEFRFGYATSDTRGTISLNSYIPIRTGGVYAGDSQFDNITVGNINFTTLYQNGVPYIGSSQWTTTSGNILTYTSGNVILSESLASLNNSNTIGSLVTTGGNVGIGITTPSTTLDVNGTIRSSNITSTNLMSTSITTNTLTVSTSITSNNILINGNSITFNTVGGDGKFINIDDSQYLRFGADQVYKTHMLVVGEDFSNGGRLTARYSNYASWEYVNGVSGVGNIKMIVTSSGNVGIGTTAPAYTLDVNGPIDASTYITSGALYSTNQTTTNIVTTNLNATTITASTLRNTNAITTNISSGTLTLSTGITSANAQLTNLNATNTTLGNFIASSGTVGGHLVPSTNVTYDLGSSSLRWRDLYLSGNTIYLGDKTLSVANDTFNIANVAATNANLITSTVGTMLNTNTISTNISSSTLTLSTGITSASVQATNLNATTATVPTLLVTNVVSTNISSSTLTVSTGITSASVQATNLNATTATVATLLTTNVVSTNISSGTLNLSTGITSASVQATNLNATTITTGTIRNTNAITTNISSGTLTLSTGITSASAQITNLVSTNVSSSTLTTSTMSSNLVSSTTFTGSNLSLSGNLNVAGTLTTVNITSTNLVNTNVSAGIVVASTSLSATGNSNTIGNIFTTGGNVGVGIGPASRLNVGGDLTISNSTAKITFNNQINSGSYGYIQHDNTNFIINSINAAPITLYTNNVERMRINTSGNVGIGTTAPVFTLDVTGTIDASTYITSANLYSTNQTTTNIVGTNLTSSVIQATGITTGTIRVTGNADLSTGLTTVTDLTGTNITSGTIRASTLISSANLSTNRITAATLLNTNAVSTNISSGTLNTSTGITSSNLRLTGSGGALDIRATGSVNLNLQNTSTGSAQTKIHSHNDTRTYVQSSGDIIFSAIDSTSLRGLCLRTSGNVGIGTTSPSYKLDVTGDARASGNIYLGGGFIYPNTNTTASTNLFLNVYGGTCSINGPTTLLGYGINASGTSTLGNIVSIGSGNVGIATTAPSYKLDVTGDARANSFIINGSGTYTYGTIYKDANWGMLFRSGTNNPSLAKFAFADYNDDKLMTIDSRGNVGIGTSDPSYKLHVVGDIYASGDVTAYSDARLKTNIKTIDSALDKVDQLRGVYYTHIETQKDSIGLIAQETLEVLPEVVATKGEYLGINYGNIVGLLVEAIKELRQEIKELKNQT